MTAKPDPTREELKNQIKPFIKKAAKMKLKTIQKQTVLAILDGLGAEILRPLLNSFTSLSIEEEDRRMKNEE